MEQRNKPVEPATQKTALPAAGEDLDRLRKEADALVNAGNDLLEKTLSGQNIARMLRANQQQGGQ